MANGKVTTGFSHPMVATYVNTSGTISYTDAMVLARGVDVSITPETSDDNNFYADNTVAEVASGQFTGGTLDLTVDGLLPAAETFIYGLPAAGTDGWTAYDDNMSIPELGFGYVARQQSDGVVTYVATVLTRVRFNLKEDAASTQEEEIDWQTQDLTATILRAEDSANTWKYVSEEYSTEAAAITALTAKLA